MLVNVPNINQDDDATPELFNSRFADIVDVINGNIEADNIKDGTITYAKLAIDDGDIPISKFTLDPTVGSNSGTAGGSTNYVKIGTFLVCWGTSNAISATTTGNNVTIEFPVAFATAPTVTAMTRANSSQVEQWVFQRTEATTTSVQMAVTAANNGGTCKIDWIAIGKAA